MFSFLKRFINYKNKLPQLLSLINETKHEETDPETKDYLDKIPNISNEDLTKIDKEYTKSQDVALCLGDKVKIYFDQKFLQQFIEKFKSRQISQDDNIEPPKPQQIIVYYQAISFLASKELFTKDNFDLIISALSFCFNEKFSLSDYGKYCFLLILEKSTNDESFIFDFKMIENVMHIFQTNKSFSKDNFEYIFHLTKKVLNHNKQQPITENDPREILMQCLADFIMTQPKRCDPRYFTELLTIIDSYVILFNPQALRLMWEILKDQDILTKEKRILKLVISAIINRISDKKILKIEHGENIGVFQKEAEAHEEPFNTTFDSNLVPLDEYFYPEEDYFKETLGDDIIDVWVYKIDEEKHKVQLTMIP